LKVADLQPQVSIAYFYCKDKDNQRNKFQSVVKLIIAQLLRQNPGILSYLYDQCLKSGKVTLVSNGDCSKILTTILRAVSKIFIIVDGIDECEEQERRLILKYFTSFITDNNLELGKIRVCFINQVLSDIKVALRMAETLTLTEEHSKLDIKNYAVRWTTKIQQRFSKMPDAAKEHIVNKVCEGACRMFLFARLVLENFTGRRISTAFITNCIQIHSLVGSIKRKTTPLQRWAETDLCRYARIVKRIYHHPNISQQRTARKLLGWITFAKRPLKWHEIQGATSIDVEQNLVNFEGRQLPDHVRDICGSLVEILPGDRVQLVHSIARQ
jgi:hypothetical protein